MPITRLVLSMVAAGLTAVGSGAVCGQAFPSKPIRILTSAVGGGGDIAARLISPALTTNLGQPVVIDNRPGTPIIPTQFMAQAAPDGHTLILYSSNIWLLQLLQDNVPYDPVKDFAPITLAVSAPNVIAVHPSMPARSVKELITLAKARPGELTHYSGPTGSSSHLATELFKSMAGVKMARITYKAIALGVSDLIGGRIDMIMASAQSMLPHINSKRLRGLAVTSAKPSTLVPGIPTAAASGLPGYESATVNGIFAAAGTPTAIISRLSEEIVKVLHAPDVTQKLFESGMEVVGSSPEQFSTEVKADIVRMGKVIKDSNIREELQR